MVRVEGADLTEGAPGGQRASARPVRAAVLAAVLGALATSPLSAKLPPLDARSAIDLARFMMNEQPGQSPSAASWSPDGTHFVVRLLRGDIKHNGLWLELYGGRMENDRPRLRLLRKLFTDGLERRPRARRVATDWENPLFWLDDRTVAFRWTDAQGIAQVITIDVATAKLDFRTRGSRDVLAFRPGHSGRMIVMAPAPRTPGAATAIRDALGGEYLTAYDAYALGDPLASGAGMIQDRKAAEALLVLGPDRTVKLDVEFGRPNVTFDPQFSPDGRYAIMERAVSAVRAEWSRYGAIEDKILDRTFRRNLTQPSPLAGPISEYALIETANGKMRPLWDRPNARWRLLPAWSPDSRYVLVAQALPSLSGLDQGQKAILPLVTIEVASGRDMVPDWSNCGLPASTGEVPVLAWTNATSFTFRTSKLTFRFEREGASWRCVARDDAVTQTPGPHPSIEVIEDLNEPPRLYHQSATGRQLLLDPNPDLLERWSLGRVEEFTWTGPVAGTAAESGALYYPVGYKPGIRYPIVIQVNGGSISRRFSLYGRPIGPGLGPGDAIYAAQMLAGRGIMVLSLGRLTARAHGGDEAEFEMKNIEAAIARLEQLNMIDPGRIGISGFSRSGWITEYCLSHSDRVFAAAISSDSTEAGYVNATLLPQYGRYEIGAAPYGQGLERWLERSPAFNAERIRTPLRLQNESWPGSARLFKWELFARMRELELPVEFYQVPDVEHSDHGTQAPRQSLAQRTGAVDWYDFWLNGREDADPAKAELYARWRELKKQRDAVLGLPRPPLLDWTAKPRE